MPGGLSHLSKGHLSKKRYYHATAWQKIGGAAAVCGSETLCGMRYLRKQMPGTRIAGHTHHCGRGIKILGESDIAFVKSGFRCRVSGVSNSISDFRYRIGSHHHLGIANLRTISTILAPAKY
jgi:hypothetical protein